MIGTGPPTNVAGVDVVNWNPRRIPSRWSKEPRDWFRRVNNFGDLLGPVVVAQMHRKLQLGNATEKRRLLCVGSIMHFTEVGDVVWGTGVNGKMLDRLAEIACPLDVRAVRGPESRRILLERGIDCPPVFGDPALLLPSLIPELKRAAEHKSHDVAFVPNLHDFRKMRHVDSHIRVINPRGRVLDVLMAIASSERVVASSLHGLIVAQSLGIPTRRIGSGAEAEFKYVDYAAGIGFEPSPAATDVYSAIAGGFDDAPTIDTQPLEASYPRALWSGNP